MIPDSIRHRLRPWWLKVQLRLIEVTEVGSQIFEEIGSGDSEPLVPLEYIESNYIKDPSNAGVDGERIAQGEHRIPMGREIRLAYEFQPADDAFYVRSQAFYAGEEVGDVQVEQLDYNAEEHAVWGGPRDLPDTAPEYYAEAHFHYQADAKLTDGFMECLPSPHKVEEYPINPVELE